MQRCEYGARQVQKGPRFARANVENARRAGVFEKKQDDFYHVFNVNKISFLFSVFIFLIIGLEQTDGAVLHYLMIRLKNEGGFPAFVRFFGSVDIKEL